VVNVGNDGKVTEPCGAMEGFSRDGKAGIGGFPHLDFEPQMNWMDADDE